jgi:hypothetical protein
MFLVSIDINQIFKGSFCWEFSFYLSTIDGSTEVPGSLRMPTMYTRKISPGPEDEYYVVDRKNV